MKKLFPSLLLVAALAVASFQTGCGSTKLEPGGVYDGDVFRATIDQTIAFDYQALNVFVTFEEANRGALAKWPAVTKAADKVRELAPKWFADAGYVRNAYVVARALSGGTNSIALDEAKSNLLTQINFIGGQLTNAQVAVDLTTLSNKPKLTK